MNASDDAELRRLKELKSFKLLDTPKEVEFDRLTAMVARLCSAPIALVTLVDENRLYFKSSYGLDVIQTDRSVDSFCVHAIQGTGMLEVAETTTDPRFCNNPLVTGATNIRFYAGIPLISNGHAIGTLCVLDVVPRTLSQRQREALEVLAEQVMTQIMLRRQVGIAADEVTTDYEVEALHALARSKRAFKMLIRCNESMMRINNEHELLVSICQTIVELGGYGMAWVGYAQDDEYKSITKVASFGDGVGFIDEMKLSWSETQPSGRGVGGRTIRLGQPIVEPDVLHNPDYALLDKAKQYGYRGVIGLPLRHKGRTFGMLSMASNLPFNLPAEEVELLQKMADNLAFGIMSIRDQHESDRIRLAIEEVAQLATGNEEHNIFQRLALAMVAAVGADAGYISKFLPGNPPTMARTLGSVIDGKLDEECDYELAGTPCDALIAGDECLIPVAIKERFPNDPFFTEFGIEAYMGVRVRNVASEPIGIVNAFYRQPLQYSEAIIETLKIFAVRVAAEMERELVASQIQHLAFYDSLTNLPNRQLLHDRLQQALQFCSRNKQIGALLFIDLDNFKILNDTMGHDLGDRLLRKVAERLSLCVRESDTVARLGGDEFVLLLEEVSDAAEIAAAQARVVAEKILHSFSESFLLGDHEHRCTPSIGIALFGDQTHDADEVLKHADLAMYRAKHEGRNAFCFFEPEMQAVIALRAATEKGLRQAIKHQQFLLHYQPQLDHEGKLAGAEVLLRWQSEECGEILPAQFIALAETTGLINEIGHWVLQTTCSQLAEWAEHPEFSNLSLSVNVSPRQFRHPDFLEQVLSVLHQTGANPKRLKLELTEGLLVDDVESVIVKMAALKLEGVSFSLDDFGTGYSSLSYLKSLPLSQIKIDQLFVQDIFTNQNSSSIIRTIIALGYSLGIEVMAEGVESKSQREYLKRLSCHAYQGYFLSRPLPVAEFEVFVRDMLASTS
ncbi:MAG: EAL domain-containing protein [Methylophilales bacterium]|nr:EAL domain-containing protein [Methylophilales bacterium]